MSREYYMDYRFFVKANDWQTFINKIVAFLPDASEDIWYTEVESGMFKDSEFTTNSEESE